MSKKENVLYEFGDFRLDPIQKTLFQNEKPQRLPARAFDLLLALVGKSNQIVEKDELMQEVWGDTFVEEANLTVHISNLRKTLANGNGAGNENNGFIETIPRRGYRFVGDVRKIILDNEITAADIPIFKVETPGESQDQRTNSDLESRENTSKGNFVNQQFPLNSASKPVPGNLDKSPAFNRWHKNRLVIFASIIILIAVIGAAYSIYKPSKSRPSFQTMKITRILDTGKTREMSISPDGKYVAQTVSDDGKQSLWLKHLASNSNVQLIAPDAVRYSPLTFSNDGSYIYFVLTPRNDSKGTLYQIPVLGGEPKKILEDASGAISFAPDGERFVFTRNIAPDETALIIANINGNEERQLAVRRKPESFSASPAWSPDGKTIACPYGISIGDRTSNISLISIDDNKERNLSNQKWRAIGRGTWLNDASALIFSAMEPTGPEAAQIWLFPFPSGEPQRITNDLNSYGSVSLTTNSKTLVTVQDEIRRNIWLIPNGDTTQAKSLTNDVPDAYRFVSWAPDKRIVYPSLLNGNRDLWLMNDDGSNRKQLTATPHNDILPDVCGDGRYVVFASNRDSRGTVNIWRVSINGTNPVQLTHGNDEVLPNCTPDGKWVVFVAGGNDNPPEKRTIWKVPVEGGEPVQITSSASFGADVSPDGKQIVCWYKQDKSAPWKAAIIPIEGGQPTAFLDAAPNSQLRWSPDGSAVAYIKTENSVSNIWSQPINGGSPKQLTNFTTEQIWQFDWSSDDRLICSRGITTTSAILISDFKQ